MESVKATLWIYKITLLRSAQLVKINWWVGFAPMGYAIILSVAAFFLAPFGIIGGILQVLTLNGCMSSGLYLVENILKARKANFNDFIRGFSVYLWEVVRISFILWIPMMVAENILLPTPNGWLFLSFIQITLYIILNAVPELIYQSRVSGLDLLGASCHFIFENWIEWFTPILAISAAGYLLWRLLSVIVGGLPFFVSFFVIAFGFGLFLTYFMIFRGILFAELSGTTHRARIYRYKMRDSN